MGGFMNQNSAVASSIYNPVTVAEWERIKEENKDLQHAINFRRTYFFFINFITVLFLRQDVQQFKTLNELIEHDRDRNKGDNIRSLCHKYLL